VAHRVTQRPDVPHHDALLAAAGAQHAFESLHRRAGEEPMNHGGDVRPSLRGQEQLEVVLAQHLATPPPIDCLGLAVELEDPVLRREDDDRAAGRIDEQLIARLGVAALHACAGERPTADQLPPPASLLDRRGADGHDTRGHETDEMAADPGRARFPPGRHGPADEHGDHRAACCSRPRRAPGDQYRQAENHQIHAIVLHAGVGRRGERQPVEGETRDQDEQQRELPRAAAADAAAEQEEHPGEQADARDADSQQRGKEVGFVHVAADCADAQQRDGEPAEESRSATAPGQAVALERAPQGVVVLKARAPEGSECGAARTAPQRTEMLHRIRSLHPHRARARRVIGAGVGRLLQEGHHGQQQIGGRRKPNLDLVMSVVLVICEIGGLGGVSNPALERSDEELTSPGRVLPVR
jgi:hypothetical protein